MEIQLKKFGTLLMSRPAGRKAFLVFQPTLTSLKPNDNLGIDFEGVTTLAPSWGDEFLSPLLDQLGDRLILFPSDNLSVQATLRILQEANKRSFKMRTE